MSWTPKSRVPDHFHVECAAARRRVELTPDEAQAALDQLLTLRVRRVDTAPLLREAWSMRHNVTMADALYVVVARRLEVALVTGDLAACVQLIAAAHAADGYPVRWPNDPIKWLTPPWALAALVAEANHRLVGHVLLVGLDEQNRAEVSRLFVEPQLRTRGVGAQLLGNYQNGGRQYRPAGEPVATNVYDFKGELGKVTPYGVYDMAANTGWVSVGSDHDTGQFAVESIRRWWDQVGRPAYPKADRLLITTDGGGSNGYRLRLWKRELAELATQTRLTITVCHFPPGTSKWNKIEHVCPERRVGAM